MGNQIQNYQPIFVKKLRNQSGSLVVIVPKHQCDTLGLKEGDEAVFQLLGKKERIMPQDEPAPNETVNMPGEAANAAA